MSVTQPTLYDILEVSSNVSTAELKSAWRSLVQKYHPDKCAYGSPEAKEAEERIKMINAAHDILKDPDKRAQYDQAEQAAQQNTSSASTGARTQSTGVPKTTEDVSDTFFGASRKSPQPSPPDFDFSGQTRREQPSSPLDRVPSFDELRARVDADRPIFDEMHRQMERDKPIYDAMREKMRADQIYDQMREQMKRDKPIFDAMRERMKTDPIFEEMRQRIRGGQGPVRPWDNDDPEPF